MKKFLESWESTLVGWLGIPLLVLAVLVVGWLFADFISTTPEVRKSWTTGECVVVVYPDGTKGDCENLPRKYFNTWVK